MNIEQPKCQDGKRSKQQQFFDLALALYGAITATQILSFKPMEKNISNNFMKQFYLIKLIQKYNNNDLIRSYILLFLFIIQLILCIRVKIIWILFQIFNSWIQLIQTMKALILVGGYGTRMRPLTINFPKSSFPFLNKPMVEHQIEALAKIGVTQVVIAINYQAELIKNSLQPLQTKYNIKLTYSQETQALGTAGPLKLASQILKKDNQEGLFFVFNSDIVCDFPLQELKKFHKKNGAEGSIVLARVEDPTRFGVVISKEDGQVISFIEKPKQPISNKINAGIYLLNISVLDRIPEGHCMIEKEVFPKMALQQKLYGLALQNNFWYDIGKPGDYILGQGAYLSYYNITSPHSKQNVLIDQSTKIEEDCKIGPNVVIGPNCIVKSGSRLKNCTIIGGTIIGKSSFIQNSIISWRCKIGNWVRIQGLSCLAEQIQVKDEVRLTQCMVLSHKTVASSSSKQILM